MNTLNGSRIFISGATGSWGQTLVSQLLRNYDVNEIVCFSRGELQQVLMKRKFSNPKLRFVIGDVRDADAVNIASVSVDYIFHLAALKHVPICEDFPQEAIKTNIAGTQNIINAAIRNKVKKVIDVSSDKAVEPINLYGMTKSVGEKLIIHANQLSEYTKFVCVRGGNVMGSNGSVIPFFIEEINKGNQIPITDFRMTRFFLTLEESIQLLFKAFTNSMGGETFVMNMPSCYIKDLAEVLITEKSPNKLTNLVETAIRPGEKLNEVLVSKHESPLTYLYDDNYFVILPISASGALLDKYNNLKKFPYQEFNSNTKIINKEQIRTMLVKGNFL